MFSFSHSQVTAQRSCPAHRGSDEEVALCRYVRRIGPQIIKSMYLFFVGWKDETDAKQVELSILYMNACGLNSVSPLLLANPMRLASQAHRGWQC